jgi:hypothetical protein
LEKSHAEALDQLVPPAVYVNVPLTPSTDWASPPTADAAANTTAERLPKRLIQRPRDDMISSRVYVFRTKK